MSITDKLYSTLGPAARVVAVVSAMARRDDAEATRLMDTAPQATYKAHDLEFWRLLHCAERMGLHTALFIEPEAARYMAALGMLVYMVKTDDADIQEVDGLIESLERIAAHVKSYWTAYTKTCADIGIDPDELLRGVGAELSEYARVLVNKTADPAPELLESATDLMRQLAGR